MNWTRDHVSVPDPGMVKKIQEIMNNNFPEVLPDFNNMLNWDVVGEKKWLFDLLERENARQGFIISDTNYANILVRKNRREGSSCIVLVDYELACYGYTASDLGGHLMLNVLDVTRKLDEQTELEYPSMDEIRDFVEIYAKECRKLGTLRPEDTTARLVREAMIGSLLWLVYTSEMVLINIEMLAAEPIVAEYFGKFIRTYHQVKAMLV